MRNGKIDANDPSRSCAAMAARNYINCNEDRGHAADIVANGCHAYLSRGPIVLRTLEGWEMTMSNESRRLAGILLIVLPTVMFGGVSLLSLLIGDPKYMDNPLRQDLWRAGHAHAGVWLILALVALRYVDEANLSNAMKWIVRGSIPIAAILVPAAFFLSVLSPDAKAPNGLIYLAYVGAVLLAVGVLVLGIGLVRRPAQ
jgi:hypothetical protein